MKKVLLLLLTILITQITFSQEKISKEQIELFYKFGFEINKNIFKKNKYNFIKKPFSLKEKLTTIKKSKSEIENIITSIKNNAKLKTEDAGSGYGLNILFDTKFPSIDITPLKVMKVMKVELNEKTTELYDSTSNIIKIKHSSGATSFGEWRDYSNINGKETLSIDITIHRQNQIFSNLPIKGIVRYRIKFITGYHNKTFSKKNIGEIFHLGVNKYKLIDIFNDKVVLQKIGNNSNTVAELKMITISKDEKFEFISANNGFSVSSSRIPKDVYQLFKNNPKITLEEYKKKFPVEKLLKTIKNNKENTLNNYYILNGAALIEKVILYIPIYIEKEIELKL